MEQQEPQVFEYMDYRNFIRDFYSWKKKVNPQYSYATFARSGDISSRSYIKLVIDGKRNLSLETLPSFTKALELKGRESKFFHSLVHFNQLKDVDKKSTELKKIQNFRERMNAFPLEKYQTEFYENWQTPFVYLILIEFGGQLNIEELQELFLQKLKKPDLKKSISTLENLNLVSRTNNHLKVKSPFAFSTDDIDNTALNRFQKAMIELSGEALNLPVKSREISSLSLSLTAEQFHQLKQKIKQWRGEVLDEFADNASLEKAIYQVNIQLFPITNYKKNKEIQND